MLTFHDYLPSQNAWKIRVLARLVGLDHETRPVNIFAGESRTGEFLEKNPAGAVPALELEDGSVIAESNAILTYLADGTDYLPQERFARAKVMQWLFFEQYYVEPTIGTLRYWALTGRLERNEGPMQDTRRQNGERALDAMERTLAAHRFIAGNAFTIADIALYAYGHRAEEGGFSFAFYPSVSAWIERVAKIIGDETPVHPYGPEAMV